MFLDKSRGADIRQSQNNNCPTALGPPINLEKIGGVHGNRGELRLELFVASHQSPIRPNPRDRLRHRCLSRPFNIQSTIRSDFAECCWWLSSVMAFRKYPVLIETSQGRTSAKVSFSATAQPADVSLALRESGWMAYRVRFDPEVAAWIAKVIDWGQAA